MKNVYNMNIVFMIILIAMMLLVIGEANACASDIYVDDMYVDSIRVTEAGVVSAHAVQAIYNTYENNFEETEPCEPSTTYYMHKCDGQNTIVEYYNGQPTEYANVSEDCTETYDYQSFTWGETELGTFAIND